MEVQNVEKKQRVRSIRDKEKISDAFVVKHSQVQLGKNGKPYMSLVLMDESGEIEARIWDDVQNYAHQAVVDAFVYVEGKCQVYQGRRQIVIKNLTVLREDSLDPKDFFPKSDVDVDSLYEKLCEYVDSMQDQHYKLLAESILVNDPEIVDLLRKAPAAKNIHHAYAGGLLEHIVSITGILDYLSHHYNVNEPVVERDLLFLGGFFHDIGKLWELSYKGATDYTDEGRLIGHLVMGVELVEKKILEIEKANDLVFPKEKRTAVKHLILAHHGKLEHGSPKRPKTIEAWIVHAIDDLDSKVNHLLTFMKADQNPGAWTGLNRHHERFFYKPEFLR